MFTGKTAFIWNRHAIANGDPEFTAKTITALGLDGVCIKAANSSWAQVSRNSSGVYEPNVTFEFTKPWSSDGKPMNVNITLDFKPLTWVQDKNKDTWRRMYRDEFKSFTNWPKV